MRFVHPGSGKFGFSEREIIAGNPLTCFGAPGSNPPSAFESFGYFLILDTEVPTHDPISQAVREIFPEKKGGDWLQKWDVYPLGPDVAAKNLEQARLARDAYVNEARMSANFSAFPHAGKAFACDRLSRSDIDGINGYVALHGAFPPGWPGGWKAVDNTYLTMPDVAAWRDFYGAMVATGSGNFAKAQALKARIASATTQAELDAIVW